MMTDRPSPQVALITGISGQDGHYLRTYLEELKYRVIGVDRVRSVPSTDQNISHLDLTKFEIVKKLIATEQPHEIYNLAALHRVEHQTKRGDVFSMMETNTNIVLNLLEAIRQISPQTRLFQAGSSEIFGNSWDTDGKQRLRTPMLPVSLYGYTKLIAHNTVCHYRTAHSIYASTGFLYNHESPRRSPHFVTAKIVKTAVEIKKGIKNVLELGNIESGRDWGHSADYVRAMHLALQHFTPRDWIVATGKIRSIKEVCEYVFGELDLDYRKYVVKNESFVRTEYKNAPCGDATATHELLGWTRKHSFYTMLDQMIEYWEAQVQN